jgi:hypothetical protein
MEKPPLSIIRTIEGVRDCKQIQEQGKLDTDIRTKYCIFIPDKQKYIIIQLKRFQETYPGSATYTKLVTEVTPNKEITIDKKKFKLKGVIFQTGSMSVGHYQYMECDDNGIPIMVYSDAECKKYTTSYDINKNGYLFLYKRVVEGQGGGGSNTIPPKSNPNPNPIPNPSNKFTVKANSNKKPNKRTRKHVNKITHKLKDSVNTNKTKNKKKTRKHIHKNRVIAK